MARKIPDFTRPVAPSGTYPNGSVQDDPGGTLVSESSMGDIFQFFQEIGVNVGLSYNSLPDNTTNGYQFVQALYATIFKPLGALATATGATGSFIPIRLSGMVLSTSGGNTTVASGYCMYNNQLVRFTGSTIVTPTGGNVVAITISAPLDGMPVAALGAISSVLSNSAAHFKFSTLTEYYAALGITGINSNIFTINQTLIALPPASYSTLSIASNWAALAGTSPGYSIDGIGNVYLRGTLTNPSVAAAGSSLTATALPAGYRPSNQQSLSATAYNGSTYVPIYITIFNSGGIAIGGGLTPAATGCQIYLDGLKFNIL